MDKIEEELHQIKSNFVLNGPKFTGSQQILLDVCSQTMAKAATYLTISSRQEVNIALRRT